jgi:dynein heavy chain
LEQAASWGADNPRDVWLYDFPAQVVLLASQVVWTDETESALEEVESGNEDALKKHLDISTKRLGKLIRAVLGKLTAEVRTKIISFITIDVHARDVVARLVKGRVGGPMEFAWQSQLKYTYQEDTKDTIIRMNDFKFWYVYEYVGNSGRLVITPLTDRCYVTLTTALRLNLGGAPAGPAGTGKTETTKDLASALAKCCYVFNCSPEMDYKSMGNIFKGLAASGSWGCFDEFNRLVPEVLSVCSV